MNQDGLGACVRAAQRGSLRDFEILVHRFQDMAVGYSRGLLDDFHLAEDAAQDAFVLAYTRLGQLQQAEAFPVRGRPFDHGEAVSFLVSAGRAVGVTEGTIEIGDDRTRLVIEIDKCAAAAIALVSFQLVDQSYFCRLAFSLRELDDTSRAEKSAAAPPGRTI